MSLLSLLVNRKGVVQGLTISHKLLNHYLCVLSAVRWFLLDHVLQAMTVRLQLLQVVMDTSYSKVIFFP
jgi:hypothetical protein